MALEFIMKNLPNIEMMILQEAVKLCSKYPVLFNDKLTQVIRQRNLSQQSEAELAVNVRQHHNRQLKLAVDIKRSITATIAKCSFEVSRRGESA